MSKKGQKYFERAIILFFCVQLPGAGMTSYWGTDIVGTTLDGAGGNVQKTVSGDEIFGPKTWKW